MDNQADKNTDIKKLAELIEGIDIAMFTTIDDDGALRSRPMSTQQIEFDGDLWFFAGASSAKAHELRRDQRVNISYAKPDKQRYVSVSGTAALVRDKAKMKELWNPLFKVWFPKGLEDPDLALLKVNVEQAEYWDSSSNKVAALFSVVKGLATGTQPDLGENEKLDLEHSGK